MAESRRYEYTVTAATESFEAGMREVARSAEGAGREVQSAFRDVERQAEGIGFTFSGIKAAVAGAFSVGAIAQFGRAIASSTIEAERSTKALENTLRATGYAAGLSRTDIEGLVQELAGLSSFDDDPIRQGVVSLLRFRDIAGETFRAAAKAAVDLAAATGDELPVAFVKIGRALQDPANGMKGLREVGIKLTEGQEDLAAALEKTGDKAGAQKIVIEELAKSVGGAADTDTQGLYGATRSLANAWDDLLRTIGQTPAVSNASQSALSGLRATVEGARALIERFSGGTGTGGLSGSISVPGLTRPPKIGQLSESEALALQTVPGPKVKIAGPQPTPKKAKTRKAPRDTTDDFLDKYIADLRVKDFEERIKAFEELAKTQAKAEDDLRQSASAIVGRSDAGREAAIAQQFNVLGEALDKGVIDLRQYEAAYAQLREELEKVWAPERSPLKEMAKDGEEAFQRLEAAVKGWGNQFNETMVQSLRQGKIQFSALADSVLTDLARLALYRNITQPLFNAAAGALGNLSFGNLFGTRGTSGYSTNPADVAPQLAQYYSKRDSGGPGSAHVPVMIGRGAQPELFVPSTSGQFYPAGTYGGGAPNVTLNLFTHIDARSDITTVRAMVDSAAALAVAQFGRAARIGRLS